MSDIIFQDGTLYAKSKLDMINVCLLGIGEVPLIEGTIVQTLQIGTDADTAGRLVERTMVDVQTTGWYFNTDYNFRLVPDVLNFITMPPNTLRVDFGNAEDRHQYTIKNGKIYDYLNQTFIITKPLIADVVWLYDYNDLPPEAYSYIALRAARRLQATVVGSTETDGFTKAEELQALISLQRRQLQSQDYQILNSRVSTRTHSGYLIKGLYRTANRRDF